MVGSMECYEKVHYGSITRYYITKPHSLFLGTSMRLMLSMRDAINGGNDSCRGVKYGHSFYGV